jgi:hypothetical protein
MFTGKLADEKSVEIYNFTELSKDVQEKVLQRIRKSIVENDTYDRVSIEPFCTGIGEIMPARPYWEVEEFSFTVENDELVDVKVSMIIKSGMLEMLDPDDQEYFEQRFHTRDFEQRDILNITYLDGVSTPQFYVSKFEWSQLWGESRGQPFPEPEEFITEFLDRIRKKCSILDQINEKALENVQEDIEEEYGIACSELNLTSFSSEEEYAKVQERASYARAYMADGTALYYNNGKFLKYAN